jgi:hypothetical protein
MPKAKAITLAKKNNRVYVIVKSIESITPASKTEK